MSQKLVSDILENVLSISEGVPYNGSLKIEGMSVQGMITFSLQADQLVFSLYPDGGENYERLLAEHTRHGDADILLSVPEREFEYPVFMRTLVPERRLIAGKRTDKQVVHGSVNAANFGSSKPVLDYASLSFKNVPHFEGQGRFFIRGFTDSVQESISIKGFGISRVGHLMLSGGGWDLDIYEVPPSIMSSYGESHTALVRKTDRSQFSGSDITEFTDNLIFFLSFVFGRRTLPSLSVGYKSPRDCDKCDMISALAKQAHEERSELHIPDQLSHRCDAIGGAKWAQLRVADYADCQDSRNWFKRSYLEPDLKPLFENYCRTSESTRSQWHLIIDTYLESERLAASSQFGRALTVSVSALEGLVKSTLLLKAPDFEEIRGEYLFDQNHKRSGQILPPKTAEAIKYVIRTLQGGTFIFKNSSKDVIDAVLNKRNSITHLDLMNVSANDLSSQETHDLWQASQFIVEMLMLTLWGAKEINNRTLLPQVDVYGQDMLADGRAGEVDVIFES